MGLPLLALLLLTRGVDARPPPPDFTPKPPPIIRPVQEACLPSGLRVTLREDRREPVITMTLTTDAGRTGDPAGREGASQVLARAAFHATTDGGARVRERLAGVGAEWDVQVLDAATVYLVEAPVAALPELLAVAAQWITDPLAGVDEATFEDVRGAVTAEVVRPAALEAAALPTLMPDGFFPLAGSAARPVTPRTLAALRPDDLVPLAALHDKTRSTLYLTGDLSVDEAIERLTTLLPDALVYETPDGQRPDEGSCTTPKVEGWNPETPPDTPAGPPPIEGPTDAPWLVWAWPLPAAYTPYDPLLRLAESVMDRRALDAIVNMSTERQVRFEPSCDAVPGRLASAMFCRVRVPEGTNVDKLRKVMTAKWEQLPQNVESDLKEGLQALQDLYVVMDHAAQVIALTFSIGEIGVVRNPDAVYDAARSHFTGAALWHADDLFRYARTGAPEVARFVRTWLDPKKATVRLVVPWGTDTGPMLAAKGRPDLQGDFAAFEYKAERFPSDPETLPHEAAVQAPAAEVAVVAPRLVDLASEVLPNGVRLVALRHGDLGVVRAAVHARGGVATEPRRGLASWAWDQTQWTRDEVPRGGYNTAAAAIAGLVWFQLGPSGPIAGVDGTIGNLDAMLWLLRRAADGFITKPDFNYRRERRFAGQDAVDRLLADPYEQARKARTAHALGADHPLVMNRWELMAEGSKVGENLLRTYTDNAWRPETVTVVVVGGIDPAEALQIGRKMFLDWKEKPKGEDGPPAPVSRTPATSAAQAGFVDPRTPFAQVGVACAPDPTAPPAVQEVGAQILRPLATTALGAAPLDPVRVHLDRWGADHLLDLTVALPADAAEAAGATLREALDTLATAGPAPDALAAARAFTAQQALVRYADEQYVFDQLIAHEGDLAAHAARWPTELAAVTAAEVQAWLAPCVGTQATTVVSARP
ncbi:MAG: insulinase family protein [Alphaproteobacteria bacterium]|nr:insulinase family protein [Alphaproteobacteria bacterium]